jgi:hypothetical protein
MLMEVMPTLDVYHAIDGVRRSRCWIATGEGDELVALSATARVDRGVRPPEGSLLFDGERGLGSPAEMNTGTITF